MWEKVFLFGCLMFHDLRAELILAKLLIPWSIDVSVHRKVYWCHGRHTWVF